MKRYLFQTITKDLSRSDDTAQRYFNWDDDSDLESVRDIGTLELFLAALRERVDGQVTLAIMKPPKVFFFDTGDVLGDDDALDPCRNLR